LMREYERRTGKLVLPLELERDVIAAFDDPGYPTGVGEPDGPGPGDTTHFDGSRDGD